MIIENLVFKQPAFRPRWTLTLHALAIVVLTCLHGCASTGAATSKSVRTLADNQNASAGAASDRRTPAPASRAETGSAIAVVNGIPITRSRVVDLLIRAHGAGLVEQLIGLELAGQLAATNGLSLSESDVAFEYDLALRRLSDPLAMVTPDHFDREPAERVLNSILTERNISHEEFLMTIRRNAYLRKVVEITLAVSEGQLRAEYERVYGRRAEVRHIQLGSKANVRHVTERLKAGDDFASLAERFSANVSSAERGGLLEPFSEGDEAVPQAFRDAAFALSPGEVSNVIKIGEWFHVIRLKRIIPADERGMDAVRDDLALQLRGRLTEEAMRDRFEKLMREAAIDIRDPALRETWVKRQEGLP